MASTRLKQTLFVSLLLHAGLVVYFVLTRPVVDPNLVQPKPDQWVVVEVPEVQPPPPEPPPPAPLPKPDPRRKPQLKKQTRDEVAPQPQVEPEPIAQQPQPVALDQPVAPEPNKPIALFPLPSLAPSSEPAEPSHGHTFHPTDPEFRPEVKKAEEVKRVTQRVDGWAQDELAEARAQGGLPHPYFMSMRDAARNGLDKRAKEAGITATTGQFMKSVGQRYADSASSYAKTGDPNLGPPGNNLRQSEILHDRMGAEPETLALRGLAQAVETQNDLSHNKPLIALTLELRQFKDGRPLVAMVVQASADPKFDAFVLDAWPKSIADAGPPPPDAFHGPMLRSIWTVEGWLGLPKQLEGALSYLPMPGIMGVGIDKALPALTEEGYHYEFHARLLRVYQ